MFNQEIIYLWRVRNKHNSILRGGIVHSSIDIMVDEIVKDPNDTRDRDLSEMQDFIDEYYPEKELTFEYAEKKVSYIDWTISSMEDN